MSNILRLEVDNPDELLDAGAYGAGALIRAQSSATEAGAFADLSGTGSDPTTLIVAGTRTYLAYDPNGISTTWYRTRYENAGATRLSDWSAAFQVGAAGLLCTIAQVKARLWPASPQTTDTVDDGLLAELIEQVSDYIQQYTGRRLAPVASTTYLFDTIAGYTLRVPIGIRTISEFKVNNIAHQPDSGGIYTTVAVTDYLLRPKVQDGAQGWPFTELQISRGTLAGTISSFGNIANGASITGTFGFAATPPDIQAVAIDTVVAAFQARKDGASGVIGADEGALVPWSGFFGMGSPQRGTLERYRYIGFA